MALAKTLNSNGLATIVVPLFSICCGTTGAIHSPGDEQDLNTRTLGFNQRAAYSSSPLTLCSSSGLVLDRNSLPGLGM